MAECARPLAVSTWVMRPSSAIAFQCLFMVLYMQAPMSLWPNQKPSLDTPKLTRTIWPPGFSSRARFSRMACQSAAACAAHSAFSVASLSCVMWMPPVMRPGGRHSQCMAVKLVIMWTLSDGQACWKKLVPLTVTNTPGWVAIGLTVSPMPSRVLMPWA
eukprot:158793-Chlamydomonas_euryale.AAC.11